MEAMALGSSFGDIGKALGNIGSKDALGGLSGAVGGITTASAAAATAIGAIGVAAVAAGAQMTKMAAEYQSAMAKVGATTGQSNEQLKEMQDIMYKAAASGSRLSMTQQAGVAGGLGAAGLIGSNTSAKETASLLKLVEQSMVALEAPTEDVIDLFAILQTRYDATTEGMSRTTSSIATMADSTSATNAELIQATLSMGRLSGTVKMTEPEMVALAAATKQLGIEAPEVGTQWGSLTRNLASNSKETKQAFEALGMSQADYFKALQDSKNTGSNAPVLKYLRELDKNLKKSDDSARLSMQLYGSYGAVLGGSLTQVLDKYDELNVQSQEAYDQNVRLTQEYERQTNTLNSMLTAIGTKFNAIGVQIGTALLKPIQDVTYQFDQFLGKMMSGDMAGAWKGLYDALLNYNWAGAGATIVHAVASGLYAIAQFGAQAATQLALALLQHDWVGSGRSIASQILNGFEYLKSGISNTLSGMAQWVNSGGATQLGYNLGNWIISGVKSIISAGLDLIGWISKNFNVGSVTSMINSAFSGLSTLVNLGLKAGRDFIGGLTSAVSEQSSGVWEALVRSASNLIGMFKELGARIANAITAGIASAINGALNPIISAVNSIMSQIGSITSKFGVETPQFNPIELGGTSFGSGSTDVWGGMKDIGSGKWIDTGSSVGKISGKEAIGYVNKGDYLGFIQAQAAQGATLAEATAAAKGKFGNQTFSQSAIQGAYNAGKYGGMSGNMTGKPGEKGTSTGSETAVPGESTATKPSTAAGAMAGQWTGGIVPVSVTNWPAGGIGGGGGGAGGGVPAMTNQYGQTVDAQGRPIGKFDASKINTGGPGIGMVKTEGGNTNAAYADRLNIDTCEIDSFGMTPGLGKELAESGAWRPNAGAASQKLAAEIGYQGNYAENYGATIGSLNNATKNSATIQVNTANRTAGITVGGAQKASNTFQIGTGLAAQRSGQTLDAAALNAKISLEDGAYSCFNAIDGGAHTFEQEMSLSAAEQRGAAVQARDNIMAGGQHVKENSLSSSLDFKNTISNSGVDFAAKITAATTALGSALSYGASAFGSISVGGGSGYIAGSDLTQRAGGPGSFGGTSKSGGGGWVGTGASHSGWGAQASGAAKGGSGSFGGVSWRAAGGIVSKPTILGVGESGTEAIIPLGKLPEIMSQTVGGAGGHSHAIYIDGKRIADAVGSVMVNRTRQGAGLKVR